MRGYYGKRSHATADLKRTAHAVRQHLDSLPRTERLSRYIARGSQVEPGKEPRREAPHFSPRERHRWVWCWK